MLFRASARIAAHISRARSRRGEFRQHARAFEQLASPDYFHFAVLTMIKLVDASNADAMRARHFDKRGDATRSARRHDAGLYFGHE